MLLQVWDHELEARRQYYDLARRRGESFDLRKPSDLTFLHDYFLSNKILPVDPESSNRLLDVLNALDAEHGEVFRSLASGTSRPHAQFVPSALAQADHREFIYGPTVAYLQAIQVFNRPLKYRAALAVRVGDDQRARESIAIAMRLREATTSDGFAIHVLVANTIISNFFSSIWEILDSRTWDEAELRWLQSELGKIDIAQELLDGWRRHNAYLVRIRTTFKEQGAHASIRPMLWGSPRDHDFFKLARKIDLGPDGWIDQNVAAYLDWSLTNVIKPLKEEGLAAVDTLWADARQALAQDRTAYAPDWWPSIFGLVDTSPIYLDNAVPRNLLFSQTTVDQMELSCAIERFYLKNLSYPADLDQLVPDWIDEIPRDWVDGEPMRYRPTGDGRYLLYSLGEDRDDDGGVAAPLRQKENSWFSRPRDHGDWVWSYTPD